MPIYEFYCQKCNTVFSFFSKTVNTEKVPKCPACKRIKLQRRMSLFARGSGRRDEPGSEDSPRIDEARLESAMAAIADEAGGIDEENPRQAARLMRKLTDAAGVSLGPRMEEAIRRMEKGEDPNKIEEEMGDLLESEEPFAIEESKGKKRSRSRSAPFFDSKLYDL
ncbi:MAG: FmdB family zinc ribbon protein [Syntrophaceae bacterium]